MRIILVILSFIQLSAGQIGEPSARVRIVPVFPEKEQNEILDIRFDASANSGEISLEEISIFFSVNSATGWLTSVSAWRTSVPSGPDKRDLFGSSENIMKNVMLKGKMPVDSGSNNYVISFSARSSADLTSTIEIESVTLSFSNGTRKKISMPGNTPELRFGRLLRSAGQDDVNTYRIPGIVTTKNGTLIAVYDNRYNNSKDLQEDIDIGMSRSTDGGQTWESMKVIIDMGEYGGRPHRLNGAGDPCILYDIHTGTTWVAALWMSGASPDQMLWYASQPGMSPEETGQFIVVKSSDDGLTWSDPVNLTSQIKVPEWQLLLQGPGRGIALKNGTLVFPAQFKADLDEKAIDGGHYTCHSTIVYSSDKGATWHIGTGAKSNTTEAQVAELSDGSIMINMRDDRNRINKSETNGRAVAVTHDLGKTWRVHPSSNSILPEPNCMASIIAADIIMSGEKKKVLFFSNPSDKMKRAHMTIKASLDEGLTWPAEYHKEVFEMAGYGYSCLTMIDENTIGILYEGTKELFFQKLKINDILKISRK
jgi:sialidase-1